MTVERVVLIRPAETDWNSLGRRQGWVATPINDHGRQQARSLAKYIRNIGLGVLYTSDLRRAVETAAILTDGLDLAVIQDERLRERSIGKWQGMTLTEIRNWYPDEYRQLQSDVQSYRIPGGESRRAVKERVMAAFADYLKQDRARTIGILSHTVALHMLLESVVAGYDAGTVEFRNTSVTTLHLLENGKWELVAVDDVEHLEGLPSGVVSEVEKTDDSGHR